MAKVFVVEDNPTIIKTIRTELAKWKHTIITVKDWDHVADEVEEADPDLIILPYQLLTVFIGLVLCVKLQKHRLLLFQQRILIVILCTQSPLELTITS